MRKLFFIMSNLQPQYHFKLDVKKSGPTYRRQVVKVIDFRKCLCENIAPSKYLSP